MYTLGSSLVNQAPRLKKLFSCSPQLSMKIFQLINVKMPTVVGILTFMSRNKGILGLSEPQKAKFLDIFIEQNRTELFCSVLF